MKEVFLLRHSEWNLTDDQLTSKGEQRAQLKAAALPKFKIVYASPLHRAQQTAHILSGRQPQVDERASIPDTPTELKPQIAERRKSNSFGVAGALFEIPAARPALQTAGSLLVELVQQALDELKDGEAALIVSHDGTMVAAEKVLKQESFNMLLDHTYGELEGYTVDKNLGVKRYVR